MKIAIGSDHAGFELKQLLSQYLKELEYVILDFGAYSTESVDYPDYAFPTAESVAANVADFGILVCGTGAGMAVTANKVQGIRAVACYSTEMARLSREHNNANVLCLGARLTSLEEAKEIARTFLEGEFQGGRHMIRVEKIHFLTGC